MIAANFSRDLVVGKHWEERVSQWLQDGGYEVVKVNLPDDKKGTDRRVCQGGYTWRVQIKGDEKSVQTGNAFMETVSDDTGCKWGWAHTTPDNVLMLYVFPIDGTVTCHWMWQIRQHLMRWSWDYKRGGKYNRMSRNGRNFSWQSTGILVPKPEMESTAVAVLNLNDSAVSLPKYRRKIDNQADFVSLWPDVIRRVRRKIGNGAAICLQAAEPIRLTSTEAIVALDDSETYESVFEASKHFPYEQVINECMAAPRRLRIICRSGDAV